MASTNTQPTSATMSFRVDGYIDEKHTQFHKRDQYEQQEDPCEHSHQECQNACHRKRTRFLAFAFIFSVLALAGVLAMTYLSCGEETMSAIGDGLLWKRQTASGSNGNNTFVSHKLYLIVVFVGLFLCLVAGIMLSAWCCRGAFQNPLCCPCYLCACCCGLEILDCIACGLCAEGIENA